MTSVVQKQEKAAGNFKQFFQLKIFRYTFLKMLKSVSTYITTILVFLLMCAVIIPYAHKFRGTYIEIISEMNAFSSWMLFIIFIGLSTFFWGFKSVQVLRDEISDGTLLIFSSMPYTRIRLIVEKWIALQVVSLLYLLVALVVPLSISYPISNDYGRFLFSGLGNMVLASIIIQLFFTTFGLFLSIFMGSKGVVGFSFLLGALTAFGALTPLFISMSKISLIDRQNPSNYIYTSARAGSAYKILKDMGPEKDLFLKLTDPRGWPLWTVSGTSVDIKIEDYEEQGIILPSQLTKIVEQFSTYLSNYAVDPKDFVNDTRIKIAINNMITSFATNDSNKITYPELYNFLTDNKLQFDHLDYHYNKIENKVTINNDHIGSNLLQDWYDANSKNPNELQTARPNYSIEKLKAGNDPEINSLNKIYNKLIDLKVIDLNSYYRFKKSYHVTTYDKTSASYNEEILSKIFNNLDSAGAISKVDNLKLWKDSFAKRPRPFIEEFVIKLPKLLRGYGDDVTGNYLYHSDQFEEGAYQFTRFLLDYAQSRFSGGKPSKDRYNPITYNTESDVNEFINSVKDQVTTYRIVGYLNIWQQWLIMWLGDNVTRDGQLISLLFPVNGYIIPEKASISYSLSSPSGDKTMYYSEANPEKFKKITSLTGLYIFYLAFVGTLSGLTIWRMTRKDFV